MNYYERLLKRVKALNTDLQLCQSGAWHDRCDSISDSTRHNYEGQSDGFGQAKKRVEKILEDFPDKFEARPGGLALTSDEIIQGIVKAHSSLVESARFYRDEDFDHNQAMGVELGVAVLENLLEECKVARP